MGKFLGGRRARLIEFPSEAAEVEGRALAGEKVGAAFVKCSGWAKCIARDWAPLIDCAAIVSAHGGLSNSGGLAAAQCRPVVARRPRE